MTDVAVVGCGLIGRAWAIVFARAGFTVSLWDPAPDAAAKARGIIAERLPELHAAGLLGEAPDDVLARVTPVGTLAQAVQQAAYVQENGPERLADKQTVFAALDRLAPQDAILASSTSGIPASAFTEGLPGRARCLVAHPVNPPYLLPLVELCPAPWTAAETVQRTRALMLQVGQVPATIRREVQGFVLNRLQGALLAEAFRLVADGVVSPEDLDATVKHGLGLRWSFMGPFETIDLNAPGGLQDYCARYGGLYAELQQQMTPRAWDDALVSHLDAAQRKSLPGDRHVERQAWRDRRLMALLAHKQAQDKDDAAQLGRRRCRRTSRRGRNRLWCRRLFVAQRLACGVAAWSRRLAFRRRGSRHGPTPAERLLRTSRLPRTGADATSQVHLSRNVPMRVS